MGDKEKLVWALKTGDIEVVRASLVTSDDVNRVVEERSGRVPLHYVADFGHKDVMEYLVSKGANVNVLDNHGLTPLISACYENHSDCVRFLLEKGADKEQKGPDGKSAFEAAESDEMKALLK